MSGPSAGGGRPGGGEEGAQGSEGRVCGATDSTRTVGPEGREQGPQPHAQGWERGRASWEDIPSAGETHPKELNDHQAPQLAGTCPRASGLAELLSAPESLPRAHGNGEWGGFCNEGSSQVLDPHPPTLLWALCPLPLGPAAAS